MARHAWTNRKRKHKTSCWNVIYYIYRHILCYYHLFYSWCRFRHEFDIPNIAVNSLHGASTPAQAEKELNEFFSMEQTVALIKPGVDPEKRS